ncbi:MAG: threonine--tRNA ligase [Verrucomicrobia bacterium 61-8]|nr:threonine--tRNA ligase [Verrucomicrobiota bacterium]OJV12295.1 MAG: threonine--tRNA ligase [Verrucomicrobia bacterium 61-8]
MTELETLRHSCAHVLATAILKIWPEAQFAAGPPVENGFYYDLELPHRITPEDFARIEEEMKKEIKANNRFERVEVSREEAIAMAERGELAALGGRGEPSKFKLDIVQHIPDGEVITIYRNGQFTDLCAGPHVSHTGRIGAFKLTHLASAYYKGDERNPQLQRVYGTAFKNKTEMEAYFTMLEEAKKRDHRKIGREMELFCFDEDVGPGLPLWLPKGTVLVEELERLAKETEFAAGYQRVRTPHIARESMYKCSGHLPYYADSMFPPMEFSEEEGGDSVKYYLKAMNCPHHHKLFGAVQRSYRDLPLRLAEYGACYRYEQSGELFGLMRVRSMQMNDAHIYCTEEQFEQEFRAVNEMYLKYFKIFGIDKYVMRFSTHDPAKLGQKFVDQPELWKKTEDMVRNVLIRSGINYVEVPNEAAFYGPKIDVQVWSAIGREFTIATNQVDFAVPARFGLTYKDRDNTEKTPLCIHRAPLGTHERFIGFLIEHYAGNFPLWLAPEQVRVMTIGDEDPLVDAAKDLHAELRGLGIRAELDISSDKINGKIQRAEQAKVHTMLVIGKRDLEAGAVSVREHGKGNLGAKPRAEVVAALADAIKNRA